MSRERFLRLLDVPFEVSLHRFLPAAPLPGHFQFKHEISGNLEEAREVRLREACAKRVPKLEAWSQKSGARTVLILEDNDLQLTNAQRVYDVLTQVETTIAGRPDEVHLVSTMIDIPWFVHRTAEQTMREREACRRAAQERRSAGAGPNRQI